MNKVIHAAEHRIMPWKNGQGTTSEIDIYPADASIEKLNFDFRISSAVIKTNSTFSKFENFQRLLTVIDGEGIIIENQIYKKDDLINFNGNKEVECDLLNGPVLDLGIIYNPLKVIAQLNIYKSVEKHHLNLTSRINYFINIDQNNKCILNNHSISFLDCFRIENEDNLFIELPSHLAHISLEIKPIL